MRVEKILFVNCPPFLIVSLAMTCSDFCIPPVAERAQESEELWFDDFTSYYARWNWDYNAGTGYKVLTTVDSYSVCEGIHRLLCFLNSTYASISSNILLRIEVDLRSSSLIS